MPRRTKVDDLDFEIHVDPSCLSEPMDHSEQNHIEEPQVESTPEKSIKDNESPTQLNTELDTAPEITSLDPAISLKPGPGIDSQYQIESKHISITEPNQEGQQEAPVTEPAPELQSQEAQDTIQHTREVEPQQPPGTTTSTAESDVTLDSLQEEDCANFSHATQQVDNQEVPKVEPEVELEASDHDTSHYSQPVSDASGSRRESSASSASCQSERRRSGRSEALIQKADCDIIAQPDEDRPRASLDRAPGSEESSYLSQSNLASQRSSDAHMSVADQSQVSIEDCALSGHDEANDSGSGSQHEQEDRIFSDHSARSSLGSMSEGDQKNTEEATEHLPRSPRMSGVSEISGYSQISEYEAEDDFVPTIRGTPRPAFRSPSSVKAIQMSSPPASVMGSPRSSTRGYHPTVSKLGSPRFSTQHSPKKTPPRFKRVTPPLVLLHVTLLPLRWPWGDVLENAEGDELSSEAKTIRDAWRQLQDRMGDTTVERGILLPHPQSDYEILEERLLEALELPMRRRARILECGHYLGPSNEWSLVDDSENEEDTSDYEGEGSRRSSRRSQKTKQQFHWCKTCRSDIQYESLGPGKIFRVKVYASNGLMRGGAWEACWKEMERVDVEIEPLVDASTQEELVKLEAAQERELAMREAEEEERYARLEQEEREFEKQEMERGRLERRSRSIGNDRLGEDLSYLEEHHAHDQPPSGSLHDYTEEPEHEGTIAGEFTTEPAKQHVDDYAETNTDESKGEPNASVTTSLGSDGHPGVHLDDDVTRTVTEGEMDTSARTKSLEELEKELDEHLSEYSGVPEHDRSQFSDQHRQSVSDSVGGQFRAAASSPTPSASPVTDPKPDEEERHKWEQDRLREIYGETSDSREHHHYEGHHQNSSTRHSDYTPYTSGESPSKQSESLRNASMPELLAESARVLMQDKKNILIGLLSVLILLLAFRSNPGPQHDPRVFQTVVRNAEPSTVTVTQAAMIETATDEAIGQPAPSAEPVIDNGHENIAFQDPVAQMNQIASMVDAVQGAQQEDSKTASASDYSATALESVDPCASCTLPSDQQVTGPSVSAVPGKEVAEEPHQREAGVETIRVVETVTAIETATVRVTETATETVVERHTQGAQTTKENVADDAHRMPEVPDPSDPEVSFSDAPSTEVGSPEDDHTPVTDDHTLLEELSDELGGDTLIGDDVGSTPELVEEAKVVEGQASNIEEAVGLVDAVTDIEPAEL